MFEPIEQLKQQAEQAIQAVQNSEQLEQFRIRFLGGSGEIKKLMARLKEIPGEQKREFGKHANELKGWVEQQFAQLGAKLAAAPGSAASGALSAAAIPGVDVTEPGMPSRMGHTHIITQTIDELIEVFGRMGFDVATGPEVEDEWHNFVALNIPPDHPARDPLDNFYIDGGDLRSSDEATKRRSDGGKAALTPTLSQGERGAANATSQMHLLRSQTSTIQVRVMEKTQPPVRVVAMGRVYRPDEHDATHYSMFHQVEGLYVNRKVSMADLKTTLLQFAHAYFGAEAEVRLRPSFFPFTEPSAELDVKIKLKGQWRWMELGGCGMVDPNVFQAVGYDPEKWTGFAFGLGIERLAMRKYDIQDIRWMFENDVRFLRQF
jgi:phenylalanyl-tRNA synthetase alpha chain